MKKLFTRGLLAAIAVGCAFAAPSSAVAETFNYRLAASGIKSPVPANIVSSTAALAFGTVATMQTKDLAVTLSNTGGMTGSLAFSTPSAPYSVVSNTCGATLNGGASCVATVRFTPTGNGVAAAQNFAVTTGATQFVLPLTGTGQVQSYTLNLANNENFTIPAGATGQVLSFNLVPSGNALNWALYRNGVSVWTGGCGVCGGQSSGLTEGNGLVAGATYRFSVTTGSISSLKLTYSR